MPTPRAKRQVLVCLHRSSYYAFEDTDLAAVALRVPFTPLPMGLGTRYIGLANLRGRVALVVDLSALLGNAAAGPPPAGVAPDEQRQRVLLVRHDGFETGILVDDVIRFLPWSQIDLRRDTGDRTLGLQGFFVWSTNVVLLLDLPRLLAAYSGTPAGERMRGSPQIA